MARAAPTVVAICGSLRDASRTRVALREALAAAESAGQEPETARRSPHSDAESAAGPADADASAVETTLLDLREYDLPPFDPDAPEPEDARSLRRTVEQADAVLLGTPNYHGSYAAPLKNALDYCGRDEFGGTTVGLLEVAGGQFPRTALVHLRVVARTLNAWTLPHEVAIPTASQTVGREAIEEPAIAERVRELGEQLVAYAGVERYPEVAESTARAREDARSVAEQ